MRETDKQSGATRMGVFQQHRDSHLQSRTGNQLLRAACWTRVLERLTTCEARKEPRC